MCILANEMSAEALEKAAEAGEVLSKALLRAADGLGLGRRQLATAVGVSEATLSRVARGKGTVNPTSKEGELGLLVIRVFRSLDALLGGDGEKVKAWMEASNHHLAGRPVELIQTVTGLVGVVEYLDALRG